MATTVPGYPMQLLPNANNISGGGPPASSNASLYVGDLDDDVNEGDIYEKFVQYGSILSIRVCRDMVTRKSLGYAYVNFMNSKDAESVIDALNFEPMKGRPMRIMWSQRDPSLRRSGVGNLFVKNLAKAITTRELFDTFSLFGEILSCKIATDDQGNSKGYGFVHFHSKESADAAMDKLNDKLVKDKKLFVGDFLPRKQRGSDDKKPDAFNNLFVKNFGEDMTEAKMREMFGEHGEISSLKLEMNDEGKSKGFGFVCYKDTDSAAKALQALHETEFNGRTLYVGKAMKKQERIEFLRGQFETKKKEKGSRYEAGVNLYVKNLDDNMGDDELRSQFSRFGNITSVRVMRDDAKRSKGFGFVCFSYPEEATKAVTEMNGQLIMGKPLYVALAQRKDERRMHLANQIYQRQYAMKGNVNQGPNNQAAQAYMNPFFYNNTAALQTVPGIFNNIQRAMMPTTMNPYQQPQAAPRPNRWGAPAGPAPINGPTGAYNQGLRQMTQNPNLGYQMFRQPSQSSIPNGMQGPRAPNMQQPGMAFPQGGVNNIRPGVMQQQPGLQAPQQQNPTQSPNAAAMQQQGGANRPNVQYTSNIRNFQQPNAGEMQVQPTDQQSRQVPENVSVNTGGGEESEATKNFMTRYRAIQDPKIAKSYLGEVIYTVVHSTYPNHSGKITGMLLEMDNRELLSNVIEQMNRPPGAVGRSTLQERMESAYKVIQSASVAADQGVVGQSAAAEPGPGGDTN